MHHAPWRRHEQPGSATTHWKQVDPAEALAARLVGGAPAAATKLGSGDHAISNIAPDQRWR